MTMNQTIKISGMHCTSCEMLIKEILTDLEGVAHAAVNWKKGEAIVTYDEKKVGHGALKKAIEQEGYTVG